MKRDTVRFSMVRKLTFDLRDALANEGKTAPGRINIRVGVFYSGLVALVYLGFAFGAALPRIEHRRPDGTSTIITFLDISGMDIVLVTAMWLGYWFLCPWAFLDVRDCDDDD